MHHGKLVSISSGTTPHIHHSSHLRDRVITNTGIADLRGQSDSEVIKLLAVADPRFQDELLHIAKENGKSHAITEIPGLQRSNLPDYRRIAASKPWRDLGLLLGLLFGTDQPKTN